MGSDREQEFWINGEDYMVRRYWAGPDVPIEDVIGVFLEWDGNRGVYVLMKDGTQIRLNSDGNGYSWSSGVPIILSDVNSVLLPDGQTLKAPAQ